MRISTTTTSLALLIVTCLLLIFAGIISTTTHQIKFSSSPENAYVAILDETGTEIFSGYTPTTVTLNPNDGYNHDKEYMVIFSKDGYMQEPIVIKKTLTGSPFHSNLFTGYIEMLDIDPVQGEEWIRSPKHLTIKLQKYVYLDNDGGYTCRKFSR